jgi:DNA-binding IclR family transcriptional regulator
MLNLLKSLDATGYVVSKNGRYVLGSEAFSLALSIARMISFPSALVPTLERVAREAGETALIAALAEQRAHVSYLEVREGERALRLHARPGDLAPVNSVVVGHVILAFLPEPRRTELLDASEFTRVTRYSLNRPDLEAKLSAIRVQGYAIGIGGQYEDVMGVAAPVFDQTGAVRCALAVGGPIERLRAREAHVRDCVVDGAREMSRILGFPGPMAEQPASPALPAQGGDRFGAGVGVGGRPKDTSGSR